MACTWSGQHIAGPRLYTAASYCGDAVATKLLVVLKGWPLSALRLNRRQSGMQQAHEQEEPTAPAPAPPAPACVTAAAPSPVPAPPCPAFGVVCVRQRGQGQGKRAQWIHGLRARVLDHSS